QSLRGLTEERDALIAQLQQQADAHSDTAHALEMARARIADGTQREQALQIQIAQLQQAVQVLTEERNGLLPLRDQLEERSTQIASLSGELETVRRDAVTVWSEL